MRVRAVAVAIALCLSSTVLAADTPPMTPDISGKPFVAPDVGRDYDKRVVMVPMRDGTRLYTVIVVPKGAHNAPILLTRTPMMLPVAPAAVIRRACATCCRRVTRCLSTAATSACSRISAASMVPRVIT